MPRSELALSAADTTRPPGKGRAWLLGALSTLMALAALAAGAAPQAGATITEADELTRFGETGTAAGQWGFAQAIAADPVTGHIYVAEATGQRVDEFTPWGNFVKAFGWDVAPGAVNEQQEVRLRASGGTFNLSFAGDTTPDLPFDASEAEVKAALDALPSIGGAGASVSVESVPGNPDGSIPYIHAIAFKGSLAGTDVAQIVVADGATALSGGSPSTLLEARTRADGTAGGTGLESCTAESGCKAAVAGGGAGQFQDAKGVAVEPSGNVYVRDAQRVQKFDSAGRFLLSFGKDVNKTKVEEGAPQAQRNRCTVVSGDVCQAALSGSGDGEFSSGGGLDFASGSLFAGDAGRIQRFDAEGNFEASTPVPGFNVVGLAVDPLGGDLYAALLVGNGSFFNNISKLDSTTGAEIYKLQDVQGSDVTATSTGEVFAPGPKNGSPKGVLGFDLEGKPSGSVFGFAEPTPLGPSEFASLQSLEANAVGTVYVAYLASGDDHIRAFGPAPVAFEAPPSVAPEIAGQYATSVARTEALVGAEINPNFWTDTRFYVQYGTGKCSEGGCTAEQPVAPGSLLTSKVTNKLLKTPPVALEGLFPNTTYHYRFVAESTGGGPIVGEEAAFTTYPQPTPKPSCANDPLREGAAANLPDCRAYEMVSPVDKNNGDIFSQHETTGHPTAFLQGSSDGSRFTFSSYRSFADPVSAPYTSQYLASRGANGWSSEAIMATRGPAANEISNLSLQNNFKAFDADLCHAWELVAAEPTLAPGAPQGYFELYRRDNCGPLAYEALAKGQPSGAILAYEPELQGVSADASAAVFRVDEALTAQSTAGKLQAYYSKGGVLSFLCVLPNGAPSTGNCSAGTARDTYFQPPSDRNRRASVANALSADGSRAYWTNSEVPASGAGKVYLRVNPGAPQSASGCETDMACTLPVSETKSSRASAFLGAASDGSRALFQVAEGPAKGRLYLYEVGVGSRELALAPIDLVGNGDPPSLTGVVGMSDSLSHVYFVSGEVLPETSGATAGEPNLYLDHEGVKTFIATLSDTDVFGIGGKELATNTAFEPSYHVARVSADGTSVLFTSDRSLSGYDNTDQLTGEPDLEVYLYDATAEELHCVSCNPSGARPRGRVATYDGTTVPRPTAAAVPAPSFQLQRVRPLSADGSRLFFDSYDALLPADSNGKRDVYEWQSASGPAQCDAVGAGMYSPEAGGCISLISSGESPQDSRFFDATPSGDNVFFSTNASLVSQDPGLIDVYDARVGGGFPLPPNPAPCEGESCQGASSPPIDPALSSATFRGAGNATPRRRCRKGRVARGGRCVAKHRKRKARGQSQKRQKTQHRKANRDGRTGR